MNSFSIFLPWTTPGPLGQGKKILKLFIPNTSTKNLNIHTFAIGAKINGIKSKRNKAIGRASVVPTFFGVNEPILFGAPLVLNPVFFIPECKTSTHHDT
jgi:cellobiose-specific phosphotransferase system component IIC